MAWGRHPPNVRQRRDDALSRISWQQFETVLASHYRTQGYAVEHVGTGNSHGQFDGGIDLKLRRADEYVLVQCKHWNAYQVPHNALHELIGVMVTQGATGAIVVTSGEFTTAAIAAATKQGHVQLVDGAAVRAMLAGVVLPEPENVPRVWAAPRVGRAPVDYPGVLQPRARSGSGKGVSQPSGRSFGWRLLTLGIALLVGYVVLTKAMQAVRASITRVAAPVQAQSVPGDAPMLQALHRGEANRAAGGASQSSGRSSMAAVATGVPPGTPTPEDLAEAERRRAAEWKRGNAESMRILEKTTPEM